MTINGEFNGDHNVYEDEDGFIVFHLNRMLGSREKAQTLTSVLPQDLSGRTMRIVATESIGATPAFVNEFLIQLIENRNARKLVIINAIPHLQSTITSFAVLHGVTGRIRYEEQ